MSVTISTELRDCGHLQLVSVIASFDTDGNIRPLYVRIGEESYKIPSCRLSPCDVFVKTFQCRIVDGNQTKFLQLTYHEHENIWTIPGRAEL